jgi:ABC-type histidine transport system ATPase subunit
VTARWPMWPSSCRSTTSSTASPASFPAASASASRWAGPWCGTPTCFLFDEPLSNLDAKLRVDMRTEIKKLHQKLKTTIVYVTHDQIEAMTLSTRIAVMNKGHVQQLGTPKEIYDTPRTCSWPPSWAAPR